jgi:hypothetical protein
MRIARSCPEPPPKDDLHGSQPSGRPCANPKSLLATTALLRSTKCRLALHTFGQTKVCPPYSLSLQCAAITADRATLLLLSFTRRQAELHCNIGKRFRCKEAVGVIVETDAPSAGNAHARSRAAGVDPAMRALVQVEQAGRMAHACMREQADQG